MSDGLVGKGKKNLPDRKLSNHSILSEAECNISLAGI